MSAPSTTSAHEAPLSDADLHALHAYWRAANYLSVGQIYLFDNPLLRETLTLEHVKPRLLGHDPGAELRLRAPQPTYPRPRPRGLRRRQPDLNPGDRFAGLDGGERRRGDIAIVLAVAAALTAVFAPLTTRLYRKG